MSQKQKYEFIGILTGEGVLSPTQSTAAYKELWKPSYEEITSDSLWSGYNCATESLKAHLHIRSFNGIASCIN